MTTEHHRAFEIERKYDVDADTALPQWSGVPGVARVSDAEERLLDARYFDTADLVLARASVALRRRTGGPDEGWHVKGPRQGDGRLELSWPLGEGDEVPPALAEAVAAWATGPFAPIARIRNTRHAYTFFSDAGLLAEFVDDHVTATNLRTGAEQSWREWELELGPAAPVDEAGRAAFFHAAERVLFAAGARAAASDSKLARALGH